MERKMYRIEVETINNEIVLRQDYTCSNNCCIWLNIDQVDVLIKWLKEAQDKLRSNRN